MTAISFRYIVWETWKDHVPKLDYLFLAMTVVQYDTFDITFFINVFLQNDLHYCIELSI